MLLDIDRRPVNSTVIPLRFKTVTQQRSVVIRLDGYFEWGFARAAALGFNLVLESYQRRRARSSCTENPLQCRAG
jgi:hypothetical protein